MMAPVASLSPWRRHLGSSAAGGGRRLLAFARLSTSSGLQWSSFGGCFAALLFAAAILFWRMLCRRRRVADRADTFVALVVLLIGRMICRLGGLGGCFATLVVLSTFAPLAL
jgi:hypothetical protein